MTTVYAAIAPGLGYNDENYYPEGEVVLGIFTDPAAAKATAEKEIRSQWSYYKEDEEYCDYTLDELLRYAVARPFEVQ